MPLSRRGLELLKAGLRALDLLVFELLESGFSIKATARRLRVGRNTVRRAIARMRLAGVIESEPLTTPGGGVHFGPRGVHFGPPPSAKTPNETISSVPSALEKSRGGGCRGGGRRRPPGPPGTTAEERRSGTAARASEIRREYFAATRELKLERGGFSPAELRALRISARERQLRKHGDELRAEFIRTIRELMRIDHAWTLTAVLNHAGQKWRRPAPAPKYQTFEQALSSDFRELIELEERRRRTETGQG